VFFMHSASAVDIYRAQRKHINYSMWPMRISRHDLRRRYSNLLVIDAGSQFSLRACSQAKLGTLLFFCDGNDMNEFLLFHAWCQPLIQRMLYFSPSDSTRDVMCIGVLFFLRVWAGEPVSRLEPGKQKII
jgi:hypothetical protein